MAKRNGPTTGGSTGSTGLEEPKTVSVALTIEDWKNVLAATEAGIKALGFPAFEMGGRVMREIAEQLGASGGTNSNGGGE